MDIINDTDRVITHTFLDESGVAINTDDFSGIIAKVFQKGREIDKFSFNAQAGFGTIVKKSPSADGIIEFYLNAEKLRQGIDGHELFFEVKTQKTNANFANSTEESSSGEILIGKLVKTKLTNETFS